LLSYNLGKKVSDSFDQPKIDFYNADG
jgi:hypothetical protein